MCLGMTCQLKLDQNFTILCIEVIYSNETSPKCKNAGKLLSFPNGLCLYNGGTHTHTGLIMCIINEFFLTIKELLPIYHMTEKHQTTYAYKYKGFLKISPNLQ